MYFSFSFSETVVWTGGRYVFSFILRLLQTICIGKQWSL